MEFFRDIRAAQTLIEQAIHAYGYAAEHNFHWYMYCADKNEVPVFVRFGDGSGLLTIEGEKVWYVFSLPLARPSQRISVLIEYLEHALNKGTARRVEVELETMPRRELLRVLPQHLRARAIIRTLTAPVMHLAAFDPALPGKHLKSIRHAKNRFYRLHSVEVREANTCAKADLVRVIDVWREQRVAHDRTLHERYYNMIAHDFAGMTTARALIVDGVVRGINAGWEIPNSTRFSAAIGVHDYAFPDLGVALYLEDLEWLKNHGYAEADMGGSDRNLLYFKNQFLPQAYYKTHFFSIARRDYGQRK